MGRLCDRCILASSPIRQERLAFIANTPSRGWLRYRLHLWLNHRGGKKEAE